MSLGKVEPSGVKDVSEKFKFRLSDDECNQYSHSATFLGVILPQSFFEEMKIVTFSELPDALYFAVSEREASEIQRDGLIIPGIQEIGKNAIQIGSGNWAGNEQGAVRRLVCTYKRIGGRQGVVRIKVSMRRLQKKYRGAGYISETFWNYEDYRRRFLLGERGTLVFCDPIKIEPEFCFVLDPIHFPDRPVKGDLTDRDFWRDCQNREYDHYGTGEKRWDNVCHLVIGNGIRQLDDTAFLECRNLESVRISDTVEYLGCDSFGRCPKLRSVVLGREVKNSANRVFCNNPNLIQVMIDASLKEAFQKEKLRGDFQGFGSWFKNCPKLFALSFTDGTVLPLSPEK